MEVAGGGSVFAWTGGCCGCGIGFNGTIVVLLLGAYATDCAGVGRRPPALVENRSTVIITDPRGLDSAGPELEDIADDTLAADGGRCIC